METFAASTTTIACTLSPADLKETASAWKKLLGLSLVSREEIPGGLRLVFHAGSAHALRQLVDVERDCCRWITFQLDGPVVMMTASGDGEATIRETWGSGPWSPLDGDLMNTTLRGEGRHIGPIGTWARVIIGGLLLVFGSLGGKFGYMHGHLELGLNAAAMVLGLVAFPAILFALQWVRLRRDPSRLVATGPVATIVNIAAFAVLVGISYVPAISYIGYAAFVFYGASMLLAAVRGYAGCEVLAASNWLLGRDDQIGCLVLSPIDQWEHSMRKSRQS